MPLTTTISHKNRMLKLGRELPKPVSATQWDEIDKEVRIQLPSSQEIIETFGSWEDFLIECGFPEYGLYNADYVRQHLDTLDKIKTHRTRQMPFYSGSAKQGTRERMIELAAGNIGSDIRYAGLPSPNFIDYILLHEYGFHLQPEQSLVAERWNMEANAIQSLIKYWHLIEGGEIFRNLNLFRGWLHEALRHSRYADTRFNFANFDFVGGWDYTKGEAIDNLFGYGHAEPETLLFVTLNNSKRERNKVRRRKDENNRRYKSAADDQSNIVIPYIVTASERSGYRATLIMEEKYKDKVDMIAIGFRIHLPSKSAMQKSSKASSVDRHRA